MKKLLTNGCSFVAGDAIVWEQYIKENNRLDLTWDKFTHDIIHTEEIRNFWLNYRITYRRKHNFPAQLANELSAEWIDISEDGNSNDAIAMTTILYLLSIPEEERKNFHVVIGWSNLHRIMRWTNLKPMPHFFSLHTNHKLEKNKDAIIDELEPHLNSLVLSYEQDYFYNYLRNILMLENFLKANGCTYTFYRSLGTPMDCVYYNIWPFVFSQNNVKKIEKNNFSDNDSWFKFVDSEYLGFEGESLCQVYLLNGQIHNQVSPNNGHPNISVMKNFARELAEFIKIKSIF